MEYTNKMIKYVEDLINGDLSPLDFELDFNYYIIKYYPKMEEENLQLAEVFAFYFAGRDVDKILDLPHDKMKEAIKMKYKEFKDCLEDGLF